MEKEQKQTLIFALKALALVAFAVLYAIGGSGDFFGGNLSIRRWLATAILALAAFLFSFDWRFLAAYPLMGAALTLPYGAESMAGKLVLRALFGLACALAYNLPFLLRKQWLWACFGAVLAILASVLLGVWNPAPDAITEQGIIGLLIGLTFIFGANKKEI